MLTRFTEKFLQILRLVALMLLIPIDTSECERLFSIMNDIKDASRSNLGSEVLRDLITWYYYGKDVPTAQIQALEIVKEWRLVLEEVGKSCTRPHRACSSAMVAGSSLAAGSSPMAGSSPTFTVAGTSASPGGSEPAVDAADDASHYARFGEAAAAHRGVHAGTSLGKRRVQG